MEKDDKDTLLQKFRDRLEDKKVPEELNEVSSSIICCLVDKLVCLIHLMFFHFIGIIQSCVYYQK